jgi:hypothetical protein
MERDNSLESDNLGRQGWTRLTMGQPVTSVRHTGLTGQTLSDNRHDRLITPV